LNYFNGIESKQIALFFKSGYLSNFKIDIPWQSHQAMLDWLHKDYGLPQGAQKKAYHGVRLMGWKIRGGNLIYNMDRDQKAPWSTLLWLSHKEAEDKGGIFVQWG
jgi:hypothetical protein